MERLSSEMQLLLALMPVPSSATEKLTNAIYEGTKTISKYYTADIATIDISKVGRYSFLVQHAGDDKFGQFTVEVCIHVFAK